MKKYIPAFLLAVLWAACGGEHTTLPPTGTADLKVKPGDTLFGDTLPPPPMQQLYKKDSYHEEIDSINAFAQHWVGRRLDSTWKKIMDLTGDGKMDTAIASVAIRKDFPIVLHYSVRSAGKEIFRDSLAYSKDYEGLYRTDIIDSVLYDKYKPYSAFWYACSLLHFTEQRDDIADFADNPTTQSMFMERVKNATAADWEAFRKYLQSFKAGTLMLCDPFDCSGQIWYEKQKKFIALYEP